MEIVKLKFRPHHFMCTLGFEGKGYSDEFVANYSKIAEQLRGPLGDQTEIEVVNQTDSICAPCPHRREALCETQEKITKLDNAHAEILNLIPGEVLTWQEAKQRIKNSMTLERFHAACEPCAWKKLGVCETALNHVKGSSLD